MNKQAHEDEAARLLGIADALAAQMFRAWLGTSWTDFLVGLVVIGVVVFLFWLGAGG